VFVIDFAKSDGTVERYYYRSDGYIWEGRLSTERINLGEPNRVDTIRVGGKDYQASYFGKNTCTDTGYIYREFWRLENAYNDFKDIPKSINNWVLPYDNYPMAIEVGQVFVIDYIRTNGAVERHYYRSDGYIWEGKPSTERFEPDAGAPNQADTIRVGGRDYEATYFGKVDISSWSEYAYREFWRLENAYEDLKNKPVTNNVLPYDNYPMTIEIRQVFVIDYTKKDGSVQRDYYRSDDGIVFNGRPSTVEFTP
jgi:hypothetical protein